MIRKSEAVGDAPCAARLNSTKTPSKKTAPRALTRGSTPPGYNCILTRLQTVFIHFYYFKLTDKLPNIRLLPQQQPS